MIEALILIGVVILVAVRHYLREPVLRTIGLCLGAACIIIGAALVIIDATHSSDTHLDTAPTLRIR